jgi:DNA-binding transcriptional ArsR family regulator
MVLGAKRRLNDDLSNRLQRIEEKINRLIKLLESFSQNIDTTGFRIKANDLAPSPISLSLFRLPDAIRLTMFVIIRLKEATTSEVSRETGRSRSVESIHLNQLQRMGYIGKYRKGRKIFFKIPNASE